MRQHVRLLAAGGTLAAVAIIVGTALGASGAQPSRDFTEAAGPAQTQSEYLTVTLKDPPAASYTGGNRGLAATKPERGQQLDPTSQAVRRYVDHLANQRANFRAFLEHDAPAAEIVREYSYVLNGFAIKLNGERPETVGNGPGVGKAAFSSLYRPTMTISNELIDADLVWPSAGGRANAGAGIKVGIIDTGIRDDHDAFGCKAEIPHKAYASGGNPPPFGLETIVFNHGTHVAGTVAGCVLDLSGPEDGPTSGTWSGVAPGAELHDYNVFPGFGAGFIAFGGSAFSHDIAAALEDTVLDGIDVVNMSLGGSVQGPHDLLAEAVDATNAAGIVVAVAAGNSGPGDSTVESPGSAPGALTAGASANPHFVGISVDPDPTGETDPAAFGAALGDFANFPDGFADDYVTSVPANGCTAFTNAAAVSGNIALINRGTCTFTTKIRNAQTAGAVGVLVRNNVAGDPSAMGADGTTPAPTIPAAMVSKVDGAAMLDTGTVVADGDPTIEFFTTNADIIAGFSSRGPTPFTYLIKPDVSAPGVNVYSSVFDEEDPDELGFAYFQGTSMATPHVAGSAALLLDLHPGWSPEDVKSALAQTAKRPVFDFVNGTAPAGTEFGIPGREALARGGGRIDLDAATSAPVLGDPASASFGFWSGNKNVSGTQALALRSATGGAQSCDVAVTGSTIVSAPSSVSVPASGTATLALTLNAGKANQTASGDYSGDVELTCSGTTLRVPWWVRIDRNGKP